MPGEACRCESSGVARSSGRGGELCGLQDRKKKRWGKKSLATKHTELCSPVYLRDTLRVRTPTVDSIAEAGALV